MVPDKRELENDEKDAYDIATVARRLGNITPRTVWNMIAAKEIPSFKVRGRRLVSRRALQEYIERQEAAETKVAA